MSKAGSKKKQGDRVVSNNRRAHFDYEIGDKFEAGLVLIGSEVRSLRENSTDLSDAWVDIDRQSQAWVKGMRIPPMAHAAFGHEERRPRKLLLHAAEIDRLRGASERDGMTLIVTKCYIKNNRAKIEVALARGRKRHDKRHALREREADREALQAARRAR
ncbi:MAG TPA: SsrA-binding protein SmpB [Polyangiaceae bacterium]|nr:SsrA-binding protein SmpB [Polyangiaceae bacterium]